MSETCLFCRIARGEIPARLVMENEHCLAFRDINPHAPVHVLVIPRRHIASLNEMVDAAEVGEVLRTAAAVARQEGIADSGYRTVLNTNGDGGQTVFHLHAHVLGGRPLAWPPG